MKSLHSSHLQDNSHSSLHEHIVSLRWACRSWDHSMDFHIPWTKQLITVINETSDVSQIWSYIKS